MQWILELVDVTGHGFVMSLRSLWDHGVFQTCPDLLAFESLRG